MCSVNEKIKFAFADDLALSEKKNLNSFSSVCVFIYNVIGTHDGSYYVVKREIYIGII